MNRAPQGPMSPYEFIIDKRTGEVAEVLAVLRHSEDEAIAGAKMCAEDVPSVELWQGERHVWSSAQRIAAAQQR